MLAGSSALRIDSQFAKSAFCLVNMLSAVLAKLRDELASILSACPRERREASRRRPGTSARRCLSLPKAPLEIRSRRRGAFVKNSPARASVLPGARCMAAATRRSSSPELSSSQRAMPYILRHSSAISPSNSRTRSIRAWAQAVGVLKAVCATSSATARSVSWPMPLSTGTGQAAMALATPSVSKAERSVAEPPPRTSTTTSASAGSTRLRA